MLLDAGEEILQVEIEHEPMVDMLLGTRHDASAGDEPYGMVIGRVHSLQHLVDVGQERHQSTSRRIDVSLLARLLEDGEVLVSSAYVVAVAVPGELLHLEWITSIAQFVLLHLTQEIKKILSSLQM